MALSNKLISQTNKILGQLEEILVELEDLKVNFLKSSTLDKISTDEEKPTTETSTLDKTPTDKEKPTIASTESKTIPFQSLETTPSDQPQSKDEENSAHVFDSEVEIWRCDHTELELGECCSECNVHEGCGCALDREC